MGAKVEGAAEQSKMYQAGGLQWVKVLDDEVLAAAILDRLLFKCEVVKLAGKSYRLENRKTIFENIVL